ncbi:hypothetical protein K2173_024914 [Erythroxylum novogranatense]|uniref:Uncharacterized protein n=1 Tax=Erythroxylum novogranatense TaxID=1862640 RepID=A0AAV8UCQ9_9ROSI|nr:hypothetical protein K2173_024914 [Erythroxylum novogranatense]
MKNNLKEHDGSSKEPSVEHPDDDSDGERTSKVVNHGSKYNRRAQTEPQTRSFSSQTSKVTYGGVDGAYYTTTRTRRTGTDGVLIEESKEADKTTGQATHRISRGIHDKGHSVTRKLNAEGKVDTMQTLHNLDEDELTGFEAAWNGNVKEDLHDWIDPFGSHGSTGSSRSEQKGMVNWGRPSAGNARNVGADRSDTGASAGRAKKVVRINIE